MFHLQFGSEIKFDEFHDVKVQQDCGKYGNVVYTQDKLQNKPEFDETVGLLMLLEPK